MAGSIIEVRALAYRYPDGRAVLHDVSFSIRPGETIGLIGPNGAGKTTLLLHLNGVLPEPGRGLDRAGQPHSSLAGTARVCIAGLPVTPANLAAIRRTVGLLFQDPDDQLFCPTVLDDVAFGPRNQGKPPTEAAALALRSLEEVGLAGYGDRVPHRLSVGERKRVCLAGVLACQPDVLVLDEPTSNLDPRSRRRFMELVEALPVTKIIATHDLEMVRELCGRVLLLDEGRLWADGPALDILRQTDLLEPHGLEVPLSLRLAPTAS